MLKSTFNTEYISIKIGIIFSKSGISPNAWTLLALIPAFLGFLSLYYHNLIYGLIFFMISGFIDAVDGAVARVTGSETNKGAYFDGIIDRYVEILLYTGLLIYGLDEFLLPSSIWISALIFGTVMTSYSRAYADHKGIVTEPDELRKMGGILERFERLMLIFIGMAAGYFVLIYLTYAVVITAVLANITVLQRIMFVACKK